MFSNSIENPGERQGFNSRLSFTKSVMQPQFSDWLKCWNPYSIRPVKKWRYHLKSEKYLYKISSIKLKIPKNGNQKDNVTDNQEKIKRITWSRLTDYSDVKFRDQAFTLTLTVPCVCVCVLCGSFRIFYIWAHVIYKQIILHFPFQSGCFLFLFLA